MRWSLELSPTPSPPPLLTPSPPLPTSWDEDGMTVSSQQDESLILFSSVICVDRTDPVFSSPKASSGGGEGLGPLCTQERRPTSGPDNTVSFQPFQMVCLSSRVGIPAGGGGHCKFRQKWPLVFFFSHSPENFTSIHREADLALGSQALTGPPVPPVSLGWESFSESAVATGGSGVLGLS